MSTSFEFLGDERRSPEHPDDAGKDNDQYSEPRANRAVIAQERAGSTAAVATRPTSGDVRGVEIREMRTSD